MIELKGLCRIGDYNDKGYGLIPLYGMDGFINTAEGWNLLTRLRNPKHPEYVTAKAAWEAKGGVTI